MVTRPESSTILKSGGTWNREGSGSDSRNRASYVLMAYLLSGLRRVSLRGLGRRTGSEEGRKHKDQAEGDRVSHGVLLTRDLPRGRRDEFETFDDDYPFAVAIPPEGQRTSTVAPLISWERYHRR
jgi:hypothetical protein